MDVTQTPTASDKLPSITAEVQTQAAAQTDSAAAQSVLSSDFQTFLTMLSTQIQNQDPLNPMDSTEFAVQLATFSSVEQQVLTNNLLEQVNSRMAERDMAALAGWIGLEVRSDAPAQFSGRSILVSVPENAAATSSELVIMDNDGKTVARREIEAGDTQLAWDGLAADGLPASHGQYAFEVEFFSADSLIGTEPAQAYSRITEAQVDNGSTTLILEGGQRIPASGVSALREPEVTP